MADDIVLDQKPDINAEQLAAHAEIARNMAISLNGGFEPEIKTDDVIIDNNNDTQTQQVAAIVEPFSILKERFNYATAEDAVREIESLMKKAENPVADIAFENEFSEKVFKAIQAGKTKEVTTLLAQQDRLESVTSAEITKDNAEDVIKLGMSLKYKDLTPTEINYKYNKQFALPKEPVMRADELEEDFLARKNEWQEKVSDIEMDKVLEAKTLKPELEAAKSKLVLPEIDTPVDENYIQWQKSLEAKPQLEEEISKEYKSFTPKTIETKINFNDETNKIAFEFQFEPDNEGFNKAVENGLDINNFWKNFVKPDGTPDRQKFLQTIYYGLNKDKLAMAAMTQAKNATIKAMLPDNSNSGMQRQFAQTQEPSELDKQMNAGFAPFQKQR